VQVSFVLCLWQKTRGASQRYLYSLHAPCFTCISVSTIITDHRPLEYIQTQPHVTRRQARWIEWLGEFSLTWQYRPGKEGVAPDALSRIMTMVVEPGWLARGYRAQVASEDEETSWWCARVGLVDGYFSWLTEKGYSCFTGAQVVRKCSWLYPAV
jgi:RNase H-like domain found in reverse transcriptase